MPDRAGGIRAKPRGRPFPRIDAPGLIDALGRLETFIAEQALVGRRVTQLDRAYAVLGFMADNPQNAMEDAVALVAARWQINWRRGAGSEAALVQLVYPTIQERRRYELASFCDLMSGIEVERIATLLTEEGGFEALVHLDRRRRRRLRQRLEARAKELAQPPNERRSASTSARARPKPAAPLAARRGTDSAGTPRPSRREPRSGG
jgi:hypothetical protein